MANAGVEIKTRIGASFLNMRAIHLQPCEGVASRAYGQGKNSFSHCRLKGFRFERAATAVQVEHSGGTKNGGTVFKLTPPAAAQTQWNETMLYSFTGLNGWQPAAGLILDAAAGALYGTTFAGGKNDNGGMLNNGTIFELK